MPNTPRRVSFHTLGCRLNQAETAIFADSFKSKHYQSVVFGQPTDLLVINTCSVTERAEADCRNAVRKILRQSPKAFVAITGCYAQTGAARLSTIPGVDLIVGNQFKMELPEYLQALPTWSKRQKPQVRHRRIIDRESFVIAGTGAYDQTRAHLKIQDGCNFMCSFCLIPSARGRERSRLLDDTLREAEELVARGHQELVLTGVNIGQYALKNSTLLSLIQRLERIEGLRRIRISSIEPTTIPEELLEYMVGSSKLCRHFHVPLQSGDNTILSAMNRRYTAQDYLDWAERAVRRVPDLCLGTDVMVGFPGEGERQFANTRAMLMDFPFAYFHVFSYSQRPGTSAVRLTSKVPPGIIKSRSRLLTDLSRQKRLLFYHRFIGSTMEVLVEDQQHSGLWTGLTDNYIRVGVPASGSVANEIHNVMITGVMNGLAIGKFEQPSQSHPTPTLLHIIAGTESPDSHMALEENFL